jgi:hypothetical protein
METIEIQSEPVTIVKTPLTTVSTPITNADDEVHAEEEAPKRSKPGRPVGSKSKEPGKPRAPRKAKSVVAPVEQEELPRVLPGSLPIPTLAHNDTTAVMLELLRRQANQRHTRKTDLWKSWFQ